MPLGADRADVRANKTKCQPRTCCHQEIRHQPRLFAAARRSLFHAGGVRRPLPTTLSSALVCPLSTRGNGRPSSA